MDILEQFKRFAINGSPAHYKQLCKIAFRQNHTYWNSLASHFVWTRLPKKIKQSPHQSKNADWFVGGKINFFESLFRKKKPGDIAWTVFDQHGRKQNLTYRQVSQKATNLAGYLASRGARVRKVALILTADPYIAALSSLACLKLGIRFGFIYSKFPKTMVETLLKVANPDYVIGDTLLLNKISKKIKKIAITPQLIDSSKNTKPTVSYSADATQPSFILFTSGTTDTPKALLSGTAGCHIASLLCGSLFYTGSQTRQTHWAPLDFAWGATLILGFLGPFHLGYRLIFDKRKFQLDSKHIQKIIQNEGVDSLLLAPSFLEKQSKTKFKLSVKKVILGGDLMSQAAWTGCKNTFNSKKTRVVNIYGSNECGSVMMFNFVNSNSTKNTMKPLPGVHFKVQLSKGSKIGTLYFKNHYPSLLFGQIGNVKSFRALWTLDSQYLMTQDLARNIGSQVELLGRQDRLTKSKGRYVDLDYLEKLLIKATPYRKFYFASVTQPKKSFVLFSLGSSKHRAKIIEAIRKGMGGYAVPEQIFFLKAFPHNQSGKIDENKLLKAYGIHR